MFIKILINFKRFFKFIRKIIVQIDWYFLIKQSVQIDKVFIEIYDIEFLLINKKIFKRFIQMDFILIS